jgi:hypothetical protein
VPEQFALQKIEGNGRATGARCSRVRGDPI